MERSYLEMLTGLYDEEELFRPVQKSLVEMVCEHLKTIQKPAILLFGGNDSQFLALCAQKLGMKLTLAHTNFLSGGCPADLAFFRKFQSIHDKKEFLFLNPDEAFLKYRETIDQMVFRDVRAYFQYGPASEYFGSEFFYINGIDGSAFTKPWKPSPNLYIWGSFQEHFDNMRAEFMSPLCQNDATAWYFQNVYRPFLLQPGAKQEEISKKRNDFYCEYFPEFVRLPKGLVSEHTPLTAAYRDQFQAARSAELMKRQIHLGKFIGSPRLQQL